MSKREEAPALTEPIPSKVRPAPLPSIRIRVPAGAAFCDSATQAVAKTPVTAKAIQGSCLVRELLSKLRGVIRPPGATSRLRIISHWGLQNIANGSAKGCELESFCISARFQRHQCAVSAAPQSETF